MKGYKAFDKGYICKGFQYEVGKVYTIDGNLEMCKNGFHFCKNLIDVFGYYTDDRCKTILAEVEAVGNIKQEGTKYCTDSIRIVRTVDWEEVDNIIRDGKRNSGDFNSGNYNSGNYNSGYRNSGDFNSGNYNSGNYNSGYRNSGDFNSGNYNSGDFNSGNYNSGYFNSGCRNSGDFNSGNYNSGYYNSGCRNSGDFNSGNYNSGYYNSGNCNSGYFNSDTPTVRLFNMDSGISYTDFFNLHIDFENLEKSKTIIEKLPNYDAEVFYKATGIDWRENK